MTKSPHSITVIVSMDLIREIYIFIFLFPFFLDFADNISMIYDDKHNPMNWYKRLNNAWKSYSTKKKNDGEYYLSAIQSFANDYKRRLRTIEYHLKQKDYIFGKWNAILIHKKDGGDRPLIIPNSINDKIVLKAISDYLSNILSSKFKYVQSISFAYQKGKSTRDALIRLKKIHHPNNILLKLDIKHFFDEIDKEILMQLIDKLSMDDYVKKLIQSAIAPSVDYSRLKKSDIDKFPKGGIPQGNPISAVLSNLYLYELDKLAISKGWKMVRYADDIVFSVFNIKEAQLILSQVEEYLLNNRKLTIHPLKKSSDAKTAIFINPQKNSMKYLGVIFNGQNLFPTKECCDRLIKRIRTILKCTSTSEKKGIDIKKTIAQWCGYYAFTDITNSQIKWMNNAINYHIHKYKLNMPKVNIAANILKTKKRQNSRFTKLFSSVQFGEEYGWLNIYG